MGENYVPNSENLILFSLSCTEKCENLYYILLKANFFILQIHIYYMYFCWSCEMHTWLLRCQWILYCLETICVCELHIDTFNISESLDGALFYLQALKSCEKATKPVYVSPGHKISIDSATELVHRCSKYRVPEPIRQVNPRPMDSVHLIYGFFSTGFYRIFLLIHFYK